MPKQGDISPLLCHPDAIPEQKGYRLECPVCGSFWDIESCAHEYVYDGDYPMERGHFDAHIGELKVSSLQRWLSKLKISLDQHTVCEVGFGGGHCLAYLNGQAKAAYGIEVVQENIDHAIAMGIPADNLMLMDDRKETLSRPVSLWIFQDSFEHIIEIRPFLKWLAENSTGDARMLIVAPDASSLSRKIMGRYWPHKIPDHLFHWSAAGLENLLGKYGFKPVKRFNPVKHVSSCMLLNHLERSGMRGIYPVFKKMTPSMDVWFNIGEMGILFRKEKRSEA